ncbi:purine and uridine phosphorylase, partial [Lepidopterella palustris CBS 459.81]
MEVTRYSVGWIAPLPLELTAAKAVLDEDYGDIHVGDYIYHGGRIGQHDIVMAVQPKMGTDAASDLAARMRAAFRNIQFFMVVGIGGGVPSYGPPGASAQIVLGDVVVSCPRDKHGGVVRYDFGAWTDGGLEISGHTNSPPDFLLAAVYDLKARHSMAPGTKIPTFLQEMRSNIHIDERQNFEDQGAEQDRLFQENWSHPKRSLNEDCENCCDLSRSHLRQSRGLGAARQIDTPKIHYGNIASSNQLQISAPTRNRLQKELGVICFEMEGAGVIQKHPCLVIRGICDYSDSHKNKKWQPYAAATAAAYTKELLEILPASNFAPSPSVNQIKEPGHPALQMLAAPQAAFNAHGKDDDPRCLPNTRVQVLQQMRTWADGDDGRYIFWLSGWAGTGKSTIARTIAREYYDKGYFTASFFFSRGGGDVSHAGKFAGTIAFQLAQRCAAFKSLLVKAISNDEGISSRTLKDQWNELVLQPLSKLGAGPFQAPLLIIVDALDECEKESDVKQVLYLLSNLRRSGGVHFRVFITSRPDIPVRHGFSLVPNQDHQDFVLHDIPRSIINGDISAFLQHSLTDIRRKYALDKNWPGEEAIRHLVRKAAGLFIWAATACKFIDEGGNICSPDRLSDILEGDGSDIEPEEELNNIYIKVLDSSISPYLKQREKEKAYAILRGALGAIVTLFSPLPVPSLAQLLHMPEPKVGAMLGGLHSILDIPKDPIQPIRLHHPSLRDFLLSSQRCSDVHFWVDEKKAHEALANHCIRLMSEKLQRDIYSLGDPGARVAQVPPEPLARCLPAELQYACRYWIDHLQRSEYRLYNDDKVHCFLRDHLLHWIEALSWIKQSSEGIRAIASLQSMVNSKDDRNLHMFLYDAKRFFLYNRSIIEEAPLQTYCSALAFAPQKSQVRKQFEEEMVNWMKTSPPIVEWSALVQTLEGHTG